MTIDEQIADLESQLNASAVKDSEVRARLSELRKEKEFSEPHNCWMCKQPGATIRTEPQPPDNQAWWFHKDCYWKLQDILN